MSKMFDIVSKTWNPVTGCLHFCKYCWARKFAEERLKHTSKYRHGFSPRMHFFEFDKEFNKDCVFVCDMGDLFGDWVPDDWILRVIGHIKRFPESQFLFLTKNPKRYHEFLKHFPENAFLGATIETNKDDLYREYKISRAPLPSERYRYMRDLRWHNKFVSVEPILDFDLGVFIRWIRDIRPKFVYIGYDNYNFGLPEPPIEKTKKLIGELREYTEVRVKTLRERKQR